MAKSKLGDRNIPTKRVAIPYSDSAKRRRVNNAPIVKDRSRFVSLNIVLRQAPTGHLLHEYLYHV